MSRKLRLLGILVSFCFVVSCGGGSTTKGVGKSSFNTAPYRGSWEGPIYGTNIQGLAKYRFVIGEFGGVIELFENKQCPTGLNGKIINSNPFSWVSTYTCFIPGSGVCTVQEKGTLQLSGGDRIIGDFSQNGNCATYVFSHLGNFSYLKRSS